ncbi:uncharacterized protein LOC117169996 [Belonocnema kinseyi]|uniref:uncharacterized protein LOC117169996 n=1 Tax=Belonocnema kinseyi TaxID=2817044 RepID=UPI00143D1BE0|nr:uncharacterized protein LOC117169996 [Belonocnema kinseyi]
MPPKRTRGARNADGVQPAAKTGRVASANTRGRTQATGRRSSRVRGPIDVVQSPPSTIPPVDGDDEEQSLIGTPEREILPGDNAKTQRGRSGRTGWANSTWVMNSPTLLLNQPVCRTYATLLEFPILTYINPSLAKHVWRPKG